MGTESGKDRAEEHPIGSTFPHKVAKQIRLPQGQWDRLTDEAKKEGWTVAEYVRLIIDLHFARKTESDRTMQRIRDLERKLATLDDRVEALEKSKGDPGA
jgi:predicted DNA-binding protein